MSSYKWYDDISFKWGKTEADTEWFLEMMELYTKRTNMMFGKLGPIPEGSYKKMIKQEGSGN